jgi:hypothetical protein
VNSNESWAHRHVLMIIPSMNVPLLVKWDDSIVMRMVWTWYLY